MIKNTSKNIKRYIRIYEGFGAGSETKVIYNVCSIISKRTGIHYFLSPAPALIDKSEGKFEGLFALGSDGSILRFNWHLGGSSSEIQQVDYWKRATYNPDLTLDTQGENIVKIIDIIVSMIKNPTPDTYKMEEDANFSISSGSRSDSKETSESINAWFRDMNLDEHKLANTRISHLYKQSYLYWFDHVRTAKYKLISDQTFRNYLINSFEKNNIKNIFMRDITVRKASHETAFVPEQEKKTFNQSLFAMTLQDTIEYLKASVRMVTRGHENGLVICGSAGIGKSRLVKDVLKDDGVHYKVFSGGIKNTQALFKILSSNNEDNLVIVFDDTDEVMEKSNSDIMKAALAPGHERIVTWYDAKFTDTSKKNLPQIHFKSSIIIITNKPKNKIPDAIISRTAPIEIKVDIPEVIDNIRINLDGVMTYCKEATRAIKEEVLDFIESVLKDQITHLDYRLFERAVIYRLSGYPEWKKFILPILK